MISLNITGKCANCPAIDPTADTNKMLSATEIFVFPSVECRNAALCRHLEQYITDRLQEDRLQKELEEGDDE